MKKREIGLLLGVFFSVACVLGGCESTKKVVLDPEDPVTIDIWTYYNANAKASFDELVQEFNDSVGAENGVIVKASSSGGVDELVKQVDMELLKEKSDRNLPEIVGCYMDTAYQIYQEDGLVDLNHYFTEKELSEYVDAYLQEGYIGDDLVLFPVAKSTEILALNETDWEEFSRECGVSEDIFSTWEGIADTAKKYYEWTDAKTETPNDGKAMFGQDSLANYMNVGSSQLGQPIFTVNNNKVKITLDEAVMKKLWDNYYVPYISGYYGSYGRFRSDDMQMGNIISCVSSSTSAAFLPSEVTLNDESTYPINIKIMELPRFLDTENEAVQQGAGMVLTKSDEKHEYGASLFLKWFTEKEQNVRFSAASSYLPVKKDSNDYSYIEKQIESNGILCKDIVKQALEVSVQQVNTYQLTHSHPFTNSSTARSILEDSLFELEEKDRQQVVKLLDSGISLDDAVAQINTEEHYQEWLQELYSNLNKIAGV